MSGGGGGYQHNPIDWGDHGSNKRGRTVVVLLRHGETQWNQQGRYQGQLNSDLTKEGERQALLAAKRLGRRFKFDAVVSSDLGRAAQTADIVVKNLPGRRLAINFDPSCRERNWGLWEGRTIPETRNLSDGSKQSDDKYAMDFAPAGGETRAALQIRAQNFFAQLLRQQRGNTVLVVTHGAFMQELVKSLLGMMERVKGRRTAVKTPNGCICVLALEPDESEWSLLSSGDTAHLEPPPSSWMPSGLLGLLAGVIMGAGAASAYAHVSTLFGSVCTKL